MSIVAVLAERRRPKQFSREYRDSGKVIVAYGGGGGGGCTPAPMIPDILKAHSGVVEKTATEIAMKHAFSASRIDAIENAVAEIVRKHGVPATYL